MTDTNIDISKDCDWRFPDDEALPVTKCKCGKEFIPWDFVISIYPDTETKCPCGKKLYFTQEIHIYEVIE